MPCTESSGKPKGSLRPVPAAIGGRGDSDPVGAGTLVALAAAWLLGLVLALLVLLLSLLLPLAVSPLGLLASSQVGVKGKLDSDAARKMGMSSSGGFEERGRARWEMARRIVDLRLGEGLAG